MDELHERVAQLVCIATASDDYDCLEACRRWLDAAAAVIPMILEDAAKVAALQEEVVLLRQAIADMQQRGKHPF